MRSLSLLVSAVCLSPSSLVCPITGSSTPGHFKEPRSASQILSILSLHFTDFCFFNFLSQLILTSFDGWNSGKTTDWEKI
jgi:hypothetical protein